MEMEKNEQSGIPDCSSGKHEKHQPNDTKIDITQLEAILGASLKLKNIHEPVKECCIYKNQRENIRDLPTATKLHGSGVKFIRIEGGSSGVKSKEGIEGGSSGVKSKEGIEGGSSGVKSKNKGIEDGSSGVKSKEGIEGGSSGVKCKEGIEGESSGVKSKEGGSSGDKFNEGIEGGSSLKISCLGCGALG
ncbi:hypothetical protein Q3G72_029173 [Acer saccharum]|nr:hypothetical protein Q3G72_029173 [Acer saccharum]